MLKLNLPDYKFKLIKKAGNLLIQDLVRKVWLKLTPEEWVRQHFIKFLITNYGIPLNYISVEQISEYSRGLLKRSDIIVYNRDNEIWIIVECKAPTISIDDTTFLQASIYAQNHPELSYLILTNGLETQVYGRVGGEFREIAELPVWKQ